ncbi:hypothetical protein ARTHRO8AJ_10049 [Arthrobacter sp. 8AJ]|nr:hypothetical protein ARTHRO8AJ_10049 [Arthrobacter sp. 8AJ]
MHQSVKLMSQTTEQRHREDGKKETEPKVWGFLPAGAQHTGKCHMTESSKVSRTLSASARPRSNAATQQRSNAATQQRSNADNPTSPRHGWEPRQSPGPPRVEAWLLSPPADTRCLGSETNRLASLHYSEDCSRADAP